MRTHLLVLALLLATPASANPLLATLAGMDDGIAVFTFDTREGVFGDGKGSVSMTEGNSRWGGEGFQEGPGRVWITVTDGHPTKVRFTVGRERSRGEVTRDLGHFSPEDAVESLAELSLGSEKVAEDAVEALALIDSPGVWRELEPLARDQSRPEEVREQALFWLGQHASWSLREAHADFVDPDPEATEVRESAVFALSQHDSREATDKLLEVARNHSHPEIRVQAVFWLSQVDEDPRIVDLYGDLLRGN